MTNGHRTHRHAPSIAGLAERIAELLRDAGVTRDAERRQPPKPARLVHHRSKPAPRKTPPS